MKLPIWSPAIVSDAAVWAGAPTTPGSWAAGIEGELLMRNAVAAVARSAARPFSMVELMAVAAQVFWPAFHLPRVTSPQTMWPTASQDLRLLLGPDASRPVESFGDWQRVVRRAFAHGLIEATDAGIIAGPDIASAPHVALTARAAVAWAWMERLWSTRVQA